MFLELVAVIVAGFAAAGLMMTLNFIVARRLPRALIPIAAGLAMIGMAVWSEYNWFERNRANLPDGFEIVVTNESRAAWRPWTYLYPFTDRFIAVQPDAAMTNPAAPGQVLVELFVFGRWAPIARVPVLVDCAGSRRADVIDGIEFSDSGTVEGADWVELAADDPLLAVLCEEGTG